MAEKKTRSANDFIFACLTHMTGQVCKSGGHRVSEQTGDAMEIDDLSMKEILAVKSCWSFFVIGHPVQLPLRYTYLPTEVEIKGKVVTKADWLHKLSSLL